MTTRKKIVEVHPPLHDQTLVRYDLTNKTYDVSDSIVIHRSKDQFGGLLNMEPRHPVTVNGIQVRNLEALYQCCRYPNLPDVQKKIIEFPSPMIAKRYSLQFRDIGRPNWYQVKAIFMQWCLRVKLACNYDTFGTLLDSTGDKVIVETSPDGNWWGGIYNADQTKLIGANMFGQLLMELRTELRAKNREEMVIVNPLNVPDFLLLEEPIEIVRGEFAVPTA